MPRALPTALLLLLLVALMVPGPASAAAPLLDGASPGTTVTRLAPLPACRYQDRTTRYRKLSQWRRTLVDTNLMVGRRYRPTDLVPVSRARIEGSGLVRKVVVKDLRAMARAARRAGAGIAVRSAYRSYRTQQAVFAGWVARAGYQQALLYSARPGHSEHQLGTTVDFRSSSSATPPGGYTDWGATKSGTWMQRNAWRYGWVMSYPAGKRKQVCYGYEPWHWRYVGRPMAKEVRAKGLTLRKFLWRRFESR